MLWYTKDPKAATTGYQRSTSATYVTAVTQLLKTHRTTRPTRSTAEQAPLLAQSLSAGIHTGGKRPSQASLHPASTSADSRGCTQCMHDTATRHVSNPMCTCCHMHTHPPCKHTCVSSRPLSWLTGAAGGSTQHDECTIITTTNMRTPATNVARRQIVCSCCTTHTTY
jgi:hypothetical protein